MYLCRHVIGGGGVQLHFCTWPPDFCQMYKNVQNMFFPVWKFPG